MAFSLRRCSTSLWLSLLSGSMFNGTTATPVKSPAVTCGMAACRKHRHTHITQSIHTTVVRPPAGKLPSSSTPNISSQLHHRAQHLFLLSEARHLARAPLAPPPPRPPSSLPDGRNGRLWEIPAKNARGPTARFHRGSQGGGRNGRRGGGGGGGSGRDGGIGLRRGFGGGRAVSL